MCTDGRRLYAIGTNSLCNSRKTEMYDVEHDAWTQMPDLNIGRFNHSSYNLGGKIFVFCGIKTITDNANEALKSIETL